MLFPEDFSECFTLGIEILASKMSPNNRRRSWKSQAGKVETEEVPTKRTNGGDGVEDFLFVETKKH